MVLLIANPSPGLEIIALTTTEKQHCMNLELGNDESIT
jgi:hypothetical protein